MFLIMGDSGYGVVFLIISQIVLIKIIVLIIIIMAIIAIFEPLIIINFEQTIKLRGSY